MELIGISGSGNENHNFLWLPIGRFTYFRRQLWMLKILLWDDTRGFEQLNNMLISLIFGSKVWPFRGSEVQIWALLSQVLTQLC